MTKATIWKGLSVKDKTATRGSVRKWIKIVVGKGKDSGPDNCPLCQQHNKIIGCGSCPVHQLTDDKCGQTPYTVWGNHNWRIHGRSLEDHEVSCFYCLVLAKTELRFLAGFLPKSDRLQIQVAKALKAKWADIKGRKK